VRALNKGMKAGILALGFALVAAVAFGSEFAVEVGSYPTARLEIEAPTVELLNYDLLMYSQFSAKIDVFPWLYAAGATTIYFYPYSQGVGFYPFYALFTVGAGIQLGPVTIGYEHQCDHAVVPYSFTAAPLFAQDAGYDKVFLRYAIKF
jgi:hypothetical protein